MTSDTAREWTGDGICCGPKARPQVASAAMKALELVRGLDVRLAELRPCHDEVPRDGPVARAWDVLIGSVARTEMRADELLVASQPFVPSKNRQFVRRAPASG